MNYVVGSGPAGVATAHALLSQGREVTLLDVGLKLEEPQQALLHSFHNQPLSSWSSEKINRLKGQAKSSRHGIPLKPVYGSMFAYQPYGKKDSVPESLIFKSSLALGGLSNVWGAAILPIWKRDMESWPISLSDLESHYRAVLSLIPVSATHDSLETHFPLYTENISPLKTSRQASQLLDRCETHQSELNGDGIYFGHTRLALRSESSPAGPGCVYCGLCLSGCPYELIYNSAFTLEKLKNDPRFHYVSDVRVDRIREDGNSIRIEGRTHSTNQPYQCVGDRVFLACGSLNSTKIILASMDYFDREVFFKTNQYFILPMFLKKAVPAVRTEDLHTLTQMFLLIQNDEISPHFTNMQIYTYNEYFLQVVQNMLGPLAGIMKPFLNPILGRMLVAQGFIHSDHSSKIRMILKKDSPENSMHVAPVLNKDTKAFMKKLTKKLASHQSALDSWVMSFLLSIGKIGDGSHIGGSFPMSKNPRNMESDLFGRPTGFKRTHLVDSSVFPSLPATTITLSVMANAHRIASETYAS